MATWPPYVEYTFHAVQITEPDEEDIKAFAASWSKLELTTFVRALDKEQYKD